MKRKVKLMLDSGIFSAWSRNESLDLKQYIRYLKEHEDLLHSYVAMDSIPGKFGLQRTSEEVAGSVKKSYDNFQMMKDAGLRPIPVFHMGESFDWLARMLRDGDDYIGVSSSKDEMPRQQSDWLDKVYTMLTDKEGRPLVRTHGFGITNPMMLFRYPFYSVDSTTWSMTPGYGQILIPEQDPGGGNPDYSKRPTRVILSGVPQIGGQQKMQFEGWTAFHESLYETWVKWFVENEVGASISDIRYQGDIRRKALLIYYLRLMDHLHDVRFTHRHAGFLTKQQDIPKLKPIKIDRVSIMFATTLAQGWSQLLTSVGANTRLLSYYELMKVPSGHLEHYIETGLPKRSEKNGRRKRIVREGKPKVQRVLTTQKKEQLILESLKPNANLTRLAKDAGIQVGVLSAWRRQYRPSSSILLKWRREGHLNKRRAALLTRGNQESTE